MKTKIAVVTAILAIVFALLAGNAKAHYITVSCQSPGVWLIVNSEADTAMTFTTDQGHSGSIPAGGSTTVNFSGTSLTVHGVWANNFQNTNTGEGQCQTSTTTTTTPDETTTSSTSEPSTSLDTTSTTSTTVTDSSSSSSTEPLTSTTTTPPGVPSTRVSPPEPLEPQPTLVPTGTLPETGGTVMPLAVAGALCVAVGSAIAWFNRKYR